MTDFRPKRFLRELDRVQPGPAYYCRKDRPEEPGRSCGGALGGMPLPGSVLVSVGDPGDPAEECRPGFYSLRCLRCKRQYRFRVRLRKAA